MISFEHMLHILLRHTVIWITSVCILCYCCRHFRENAVIMSKEVC